MLVLQWTRNVPLPGVVLEWRGPNLVTTEWVERNVGAFSSIEEIIAKIAVISGPQGPIGPKGDKGEKGDAAVYDDTLPLILDGGNF